MIFCMRTHTRPRFNVSSEGRDTLVASYDTLVPRQGYSKAHPCWAIELCFTFAVSDFHFCFSFAVFIVLIVYDTVLGQYPPGQ